MQFAFNDCCWCDMNCATNHACVSKSNKVLMLGRTDVFSHFMPESRSPLYKSSTAGRRIPDIHMYRAQQYYTFASHARNPARYLDASRLRSLQVNLALCWDPIMIQCTLSSRETGCMACSHAPPKLPARSGLNRNTKVTRIGVLSGPFCGRSYVWLVPEWYIIDQAN
jgi:hypothetical protein